MNKSKNDEKFHKLKKFQNASTINKITSTKELLNGSNPEQGIKFN